MGDTYQVIITPRAKSSLEGIVDYFTEEYSPEDAEKVRKRIMEAIFSLEKMPSRNPPARGIISEKNIIYRRVLSKKYRIIYSIKEDKLEVLVVEIHHSGQGDPNIYKGFE